MEILSDKKGLSFDKIFENSKPALQMRRFLKNKGVIVEKENASSYSSNYNGFYLTGLAQYKYVTSQGNDEPRYDSKENGKRFII